MIPEIPKKIKIDLSFSGVKIGRLRLPIQQLVN